MAGHPNCGSDGGAQKCEDTDWRIEDADDIPDDSTFRDCAVLKSLVVEWNHDKEFDCATCFAKLEKITGALTLVTRKGGSVTASCAPKNLPACHVLSCGL